MKVILPVTIKNVDELQFNSLHSLGVSSTIHRFVVKHLATKVST